MSTQDTRHPDQQETTCGCEIWQTHNGHLYIVQCPLHVMAQDLLESVQELVQCNPQEVRHAATGKLLYTSITGVPNARQVLAQATGAISHETR